MNSLQNLTKQEQEQFNRLKYNQNGLDQKTMDACLTYYVQYKTQTDYLPHDKVVIAMKCALFMAEKSQFVVNVKGEKVTLPSLSIGQLLKLHKADDTMITLKDFSKKVQIEDKQAEKQLQHIISEISFLLTFYKKFSKMIDKLQMKQRNPEQGKDYIKTFQSFIWLLYIQAKSKVFNHSLDLIEHTCTIAFFFKFMLTYGWQYVLPLGIVKADKRINENSSLKDAKTALLEFILEFFVIKSRQSYDIVASKLAAYIREDLFYSGVVKCSSDEKEDFLAPQYLNHNYKRLEKKYEKQMSYNDIDERIFLKERLPNMTPSKFTPFARQGYANKVPSKGFTRFGGISNNQQNTHKETNCFRILNYEMQDKVETTQKITPKNVMEMKIPKGVMQSPNMMRVPLINSTPISAGMDMLNYIIEKSRKFKQMFNQKQFQQHPLQGKIYSKIQHIFGIIKKDSVDSKLKEQKIESIFAMYKLALEDFLVAHPQESTNDGLNKGLMLISFEVFLFSNNITYSFENLLSQVNVDSLSLWKSVDKFLKFDREMPSTLKLHLLDIEAQIISSKIWKDQQNITNLKKYINMDKQKNLPKTQFISKLFKRLLHQIALQITLLTSPMKLDQTISELIFQLCKFVFTENIESLYRRHLDQLVICAIYAGCKLKKINCHEKLMSEIIETYKENIIYTKDQHHEIIFQANINGQLKPISAVFNDVFVHTFKTFMSRHNNSSHSIKEVQKKNVAYKDLQSPLKEIIPNQLGKFTRAKKPGYKCGNSTPSQNHVLYAYNQSPMLKQEPVSFKNQQLKSKKLLNYEQQEEKMNNNEEKPYETERVSTRPNLGIDFNNKKFAQQGNNGGLAFKAKPGQTHTPTRTNKNNHLGFYDYSEFPGGNLQQNHKLKIKGKNDHR